ncbi:MAG: hypothetical protein C4563_00385 [Desulfobulbus sp.]|nr:MAG: hypothetical protein C4563_00385 [Desulfobulbus sp.]
MNWKQYHTLAALTFFVTSCPFLSGSAQAGSVDLTGNWRAYFSDSDLEGTESGLTQHQQRYDARWTPRITSRMTLAADMGYTNTWFKGLGSREMINPALRFDVLNDIFSFDLSGYAIQNNITYSPDRRTSAWDSSLSSTWQHALWPTLALRAGQRWEERDPSRFTRIGADTFTLGGEDSLQTYSGATMTWEGYKFRLFYDYYLSDEEDALQLTQWDEERHFGQLEYVDAYLDNRINVSLSQTLGRSTTEQSSAGGAASIRVLTGSAFAGNDFTPSSGRLPLNLKLVDGNLDVRAYVIELQQPANLALRTDFRGVDQIWVHTTKDSNLLVANTSSVTWDVYTSTDGFAWQRVAERATSTFNRDEFRFEVDTGTIRAAYVKLVATGWLPAVNIEVTELEARAKLIGDDLSEYDTTTDQFKTEAFLGIIPVQSTRLDYTFSRDENETSGTRDEAQTEQVAHTARFSWDYSRYFSPSVGYSSVVNDYSLGRDTENLSYDLRINSIPLPTVDSSFSLARSEYSEDGDLQLTSDHLNFTTVATLYPDLTTELGLGWYLTEQELTGDTSDSYTLRWVLRSRLRKSLTADFTTEYWTSDSETQIPVEDHLGQGFDIMSTSGERGSNSLNLNWRPSDILSFSAHGISTWGEEEEGDTEALILTADYLVLRTSKTNVTLSYRFNTSNDDTYNNLGFVWGWDFSNYFTLQTNGNYVISDFENAWYISTQLTARL